VLSRQLQRFLIVGFTTVGIDFAVYRILLFAGSPIAVAKALGFIVGTVFAYFANKLWTFESAKGGRSVFVMFMALYLITLLINVGINSGVITALGDAELVLLLGFLAATGTSATLNFIGMRMIVFRTKQRVES
jgi:putative flippase GtrA